VYGETKERDRVLWGQEEKGRLVKDGRTEKLRGAGAGDPTECGLKSFINSEMTRRGGVQVKKVAERGPVLPKGSTPHPGDGKQVTGQRARLPTGKETRGGKPEGQNGTGP